MVERITVHRDRVEMAFTAIINCSEPIIVPVTLISRSGEKRLFVSNVAQCHARPDPALVKLIVRAFQARQVVEGDGAAAATAAAKMHVSIAYLGVLLRLSHLAPDIVAAILDGRQPATLNRQRLARVASLPMEWQAQRVLLGFA